MRPAGRPKAGETVYTKDASVNTLGRPVGNSTAYALRRLRKDRPDIPRWGHQLQPFGKLVKLLNMFLRALPHCFKRSEKTFGRRTSFLPRPRTRTFVLAETPAAPKGVKLLDIFFSASRALARGSPRPRALPRWGRHVLRKAHPHAVGRRRAGTCHQNQPERFR